MLCARAPDGRNVTGRMELALTVQSEVLPKYGFLGTVEGVEAMRETICPFMVDWMVKKIVDEIDKALGLPPDSTAKACLGPRGDDRPEHEVDCPEKVPANQPISSRLRTESMSNPSKAQGHRPALETPTLTKVQVLDLLGELLQTVSKPSLQKEFQALSRDDEASKDLVLKVQSEVLPKHGFPGTPFGSMLMLDAIAPFIDDYLVCHLASEIDEKIGLPKGSTASMCKGKLASDKPTQAKLTEDFETPAQPSKLTRQQVLTLCNELLKGFLAPDFQEALQLLMKKGNNNAGGSERAVLALTVQSKVLPKYGIPGTNLGVLSMLDEVAPHSSDWLVARLINSIDEALGLRVGTTLSSVAPVN